jgi:hypothetical protein
MVIVAELFEHVVGIDTHARTHTYCLVAGATGAVVDAATFPTSKAGHARAISWIVRRTRGSVLAAVEGTSLTALASPPPWPRVGDDAAGLGVGVVAQPGVARTVFGQVRRPLAGIRASEHDRERGGRCRAPWARHRHS